MRASDNNGYPYNDVSTAVGTDGQRTAGDRGGKGGRGVPVLAVIAAVLVTAVITFQVTSVVLGLRYKKKLDESVPEYFDSLITMDEYIRRYYIGEIDAQALSEALASSYISALGDKYAYYYTAEEYESEMQYYSGSSSGIGVRVYHDSSEGVLVAFRVMDGSPAETAGMHQGDVIFSVDGVATATLTYEEILDAIQGENGSLVRIGVRRGEDELYFDVTRSEYELQTVEYHVYKDGSTAKKLGFIRVFSFTSGTVGQFRDAVNALVESGVEGLIFDMRGNGGGELQAVVDMLDILLPKGPIVRITDRDGNEVKVYESDGACIDLPMAVLTDGDTASAAELFTAALLDYGKAVSVGTNTYGKGTVQTFVRLSDGSAFKFSYRYYSPPFSENYHGVGIAPTVLSERDGSGSVYLLGDDDDVQLAAAADYLLGL